MSIEIVQFGGRIGLKYSKPLKNLADIDGPFYVVAYVVRISEQDIIPQPSVWVDPHGCTAKFFSLIIQLFTFSAHPTYSTTH